MKPAFPEAKSHSAINRVVIECWRAFPLCHVGQAVANCYIIPEELHNRIYFMSGIENVTKTIHAFLNKKRLPDVPKSYDQRIADMFQ